MPAWSILTETGQHGIFQCVGAFLSAALGQWKHFDTSIDVHPNGGMSFWCILLIVAHQLQLQCLSRWDLAFLLAPCKGPIRVSRTDLDINKIMVSRCKSNSRKYQNCGFYRTYKQDINRTIYRIQYNFSLCAASAGLCPSLWACAM